MIRIETISKTYGEFQALNNFSLQLSPGKVFGLLGPNGAGKSTALKIAAGVVKPDSGRVIILENDATRLPLWRRARLGLGYLPQEPTIFRNLTVEENIMAGKPANRGAAEELISAAGFDNIRHSKASYLSGGERRKTEIARLLVMNPKVLLLDEPFAALDPATVADLKRFLISFVSMTKAAILLADHSARDVLSISDRCVLLYNGDIAAEGAPRTIARAPLARKIYLGPDFTAPRKIKAPHRR